MMTVPQTHAKGSAHPADEGYITKAEVARRLKKSLRTIELWQAKGIIPYVKTGHSVLYSWSDIVEHIRRHFRVCRMEDKD